MVGKVKRPTHCAAGAFVGMSKEFLDSGKCGWPKCGCVPLPPPSTSVEGTSAQTHETAGSSTSAEDDRRFEWLERRVFERKWDGTIGRPSSWHMAGPYRHELMKMRGETLREAIDEAMKENP